MNRVMQLRRQKVEVSARMTAVLDTAETEDRGLTEEERAAVEADQAELERLDEAIEIALFRQVASVTDEVRSEPKAKKEAESKAPAFNRTKLGDTVERAWAHYIRTGDEGGIREWRASNDTTMNITTDADGGYAVPTGHYQNIIARRDEGALASRLGVRRIPGKGTTVNVPIDAEADLDFVSTAESAAYDRDAPALGTKAFTLVKYTKKVDLTVELLEDEDSRIMDFLVDFIGRAMASHMNNLLVTEVGTNGSALKTLASTTAIAAGEIEDIAYGDNVALYLDDSSSIGWVTRPSTYGNIASITGSERLYGPTPWGDPGPQLLGYPVYFSHKATTPAANAKSIYFGNWNYVGMREAPSLTVLRDPYTRGGYGEVLLYYMYRVVFGVLQAEAIGYAAQAAA